MKVQCARPYQRPVQYLETPLCKIAFFQAYRNFVDYSVCLLNCGLMLSESKLIVRYKMLKFYVIFKSIQRIFSKSFEKIDSRLIRRFNPKMKGIIVFRNGGFSSNYTSNGSENRTLHSQDDETLKSKISHSRLSENFFRSQIQIT
jgi:hypothetical protein